MIQASIVEYINTQMKAGVARETIKSTLTGAGWVAADVEDTLKKIESEKTAQPISAMPSTVSHAAAPLGSPAVHSPEHAMPQMIKVSDLISPSSPSVSASHSSLSSPSAMPAKGIVSKSPLTGPSVISSMPAKPLIENQGPTTYMAEKPHAVRGPLITEIVLAVVAIVFLAFAGFLYMQNKGLNAQLGSLNGESSGVNSQLSALTAQVTASTTALTAQITSLAAETQDLQTQLSFYATPSSTTPGATTTATISGTVSGGGRALYLITTSYGAKIYVANSKTASVIAALAPLTASTAMASTTASSTATTSASAVSSSVTTAQFSGTYVPGSDSMTLTAVNGTAL